MKKFILIGNVIGYLLTCLIYHQVLPVFSIPAILGIIAGGAYGVFVVLLLYLLIFGEKMTPLKIVTGPRDTSECFDYFVKFRDRGNQCMTCELKESCKNEISQDNGSLRTGS